MRTYTVHHRHSEARDLIREVEGLVFVKEGFCWPGLLFPVLWLLFRGMWLVLVFYLVAATVVTLIGNLAGLPQDVTVTVLLALNLVVGFEGNDLRRWTLERGRRHIVGLVSGRDRADAERRFLASLAEGTYRTAAVPPPSPSRFSQSRAGTWAQPDTEDDVVGLFPSPERPR